MKRIANNGTWAGLVVWLWLIMTGGTAVYGQGVVGDWVVAKLPQALFAPGDMLWSNPHVVAADARGLYLFDIKAGTVKQIGGRPRSIAMIGDEVFVMNINGGSSAEIKSYDISRDVSASITQKAHPSEIAAAPNMIVWISGGARRGDVCMYTLNDGKTTQITHDGNCGPDIATDGKTIVWSRDGPHDPHNQPSYLCAYDIATGVETPITKIENQDAQGQKLSNQVEVGPKVVGNFVLFGRQWVDAKDYGVASMLIYDLQKKSLRRLDTKGLSGLIAISPDEQRAAWCELDPAAMPSIAQVCVYDFQKATFKQLTHDKKLQNTSPVISNRAVSWFNFKSGGPGTGYIYDLQTQKITTVPSCNPRAVDGDSILFCQQPGGAFFVAKPPDKKP